MADEAAGFHYREDLGAWWPDYDHDPVKCKSFVDHGLPAIDAAVKHCPRRRVCIQAGGHAGFWPKRLAEIFDWVHTFEPEPMLFECLVRNCTASNVIAYRRALGAKTEPARLKSHISAGSWRIDPAGKHPVTMLAIDSMMILGRLDAIFLDIEGYEVQALEGARRTIARHRPVILVELLPRSKLEIHAWLIASGYVAIDRFGRDGIYIPGERRK